MEGRAGSTRMPQMEALKNMYGDSKKKIIFHAHG